METATIIPVQFGPDLKAQAVEITDLTFKTMGITEAVLEEFVRINIGLLFPAEENLLIVGQQPKNKEGGRADLVAVDGDGNLVLIELKRDPQDIIARKEAFEFQAIRYAASYALIRTEAEVVQKLFGPYIERHRSEFDLLNLTPFELAARKLADFLTRNKSDRNFNQTQRIILIASDFDPQTLSACAWLAKSMVDIRCLRIAPFKFQNQHFLAVEQIIPPPALDKYIVELAEPLRVPRAEAVPATRVSADALPRMPKLFEWGLVGPGDRVYISGHPEKHADVQDEGHVSFDGQRLKFNDWGKRVTGWSAINIYEFTVHEKTGKTLDELRREKLGALEQMTESITDAEAVESGED